MSVGKEGNAAKMAAGPGLAPHTTRDFAPWTARDFAPWTARDFGGAGGVSGRAEGLKAAGGVGYGWARVSLCLGLAGLGWAARLITVEHYAEPSSSRMGLNGPARPLGW